MGNPFYSLEFWNLVQGQKSIEILANRIGLETVYGWCDAERILQKEKRLLFQRVSEASIHVFHDLVSQDPLSIRQQDQILPFLQLSDFPWQLAATKKLLKYKLLHDAIVKLDDYINQWTRYLYSIFSSEKISELDTEKRWLEFELFRHRYTALIRKGDSGKILKLSWRDLLKEYAHKYKDERHLQILKKSLRDRSNRLSGSKNILRAFKIPLPNPTNGSHPFISLRKFALDTQIEELKNLKLVFPHATFYDRLRIILENSKTERQRNSVICFFGEMEEKFFHFEKGEDLQNSWKIAYESIDSLFSSPSDAELHALLKTAIDYTFGIYLKNFCLQELKRKNYPFDEDPQWKIHFELCILHSNSLERAEILEKLSKMSSNSQNLVSIPSSYKDFSKLVEKKCMKPHHYAILLFHFLEVDCKVQRIPSGSVPSSPRRSARLKNPLPREKIYPVINYLQAQLLCCLLPSEIILDLFIGAPISEEFVNLMQRLIEWRDHIFREKEKFYLSSIFVREWSKREQTLKEIISQSKGNIFRESFFEMLWFSTFFEVKVVKPFVKVFPGLNQNVDSLAAPFDAPNPLSKEVKGMHLFCQWLPSINKEGAVIWSFEFSLLYSFQYMQLRSMRVPLKIPESVFKQEVGEEKNELLKLFQLTAEKFCDEKLPKTPLKKSDLSGKDLMEELMAKDDTTEGFEFWQLYAKMERLIPQSSQAIFEFIFNVKKGARQLPFMIGNGRRIPFSENIPFHAEQNIDVIEKGWSLRPGHDANAVRACYVIMREDYQSVVDKIYLAAKKGISKCESFTLKVEFEEEECLLNVDVSLSAVEGFSQWKRVYFKGILDAKKAIEIELGTSIPVNCKSELAKEMLFLFLIKFKGRFYQVVYDDKS